jgi:hypothetical protein
MKRLAATSGGSVKWAPHGRNFQLAAKRSDRNEPKDKSEERFKSRRFDSNLAEIVAVVDLNFKLCG